MNKAEIREAQKIQQFHAAGLGDDFVARALSALIRAARTNKSATALRALAAQMGVAGHPEFIC
jgi:regulator of protease activity HflC (stomatin/prohibitin superfamily)